MYDIAKNALKKAIRDFFTQEEILDEDYLRQAAQDFVYEHDEEIKDHLRDEIDLDDIFTDTLADISWNDIW